MKSLQFIFQIFSAVFFLMISSSLLAESARDIMIKVDKISKESYTSAVQKMKLSTCKYSVAQKQMRCAENPRIKVIESVQKDTGVDNKDSRSIAIILEPVSDKGIGMLTYDYDAPGKDSDTWLYLSALGKVKRMIASSEESDESGSFFGTEFSIEDMESQKIDDYTYKILEEGTYAKQPVWIIESVPTPERARKTRYGKTISWIDKERFIILKANLYNRYGKLYKQLIMRDVEEIDNVWVSRKVTMNNLSTRRVTNMELLSVAFNMEVPDEFLTQRTLTDFAFRERNLNELRTYIK
ncbi:outer membrane lipoprotein-sorting protein [bacterium]|nr:outer membrane lipoprotein-sorting protein [bacterium]